MATEQKGIWHAALMKWLTGAVYASVKTMGPRQAKVMSRAMAMVFTRMLAKEVEARGAPLTPTPDPMKALEQYRALEVSQGLTEPDSVKLAPLAEGEIGLVFANCEYGPLCNETLSQLLSRGDFNKASVPCYRMCTYSAAVAMLQNSKRPYRLVQFAPGARCQAVLMAPRMKSGD